MYSKQRVNVVYRGLGLTVEGDYSRGCPEVMYLHNGDPGYPKEPSEFDIRKIELNGEDITGFFDGLEHAVTINKRPYYEDCYSEIADVCIEAIEGDAGDENTEED
jgi:hypothetical protein